MSDLEIASKFFEMLKKRGFEISIQDFNNRTPDDEEFDRGAMSFELLADGKVFACFDFLSGDFYRISAFSSGYWSDEVDGRKYT